MGYRTGKYKRSQKFAQIQSLRNKQMEYIYPTRWILKTFLTIILGTISTIPWKLVSRKRSLYNCKPSILRCPLLYRLALTSSYSTSVSGVRRSSFYFLPKFVGSISRRALGDPKLQFITLLKYSAVSVQTTPFPSLPFPSFAYRSSVE